MNKNLVVFAKNRAELQQSQNQMMEWANFRLNAELENLNDVTANLEYAKKNKWNLTGWRKQKTVAQRKVDYFQKMYAALSAGYVIVPDFPIDVFAVRTNRNYPIEFYETTSSTWNNADRTQSSEALPIGEGRYVDSEPKEFYKQLKGADDNTLYQHYAGEFKDVDFPIKTVKPAILDETSKALALKIFDEIGCNPGRPGWTPGRGVRRGADPMVIGRIIYRSTNDSPGSRWGRNFKTVSFLITWWLNTKDIDV
jgi:hypothetical protein